MNSRNLPRPSHRWTSFCLALPFVFILGPSVAQAQYLLQTGAPTFTTAEPVEMGFVNVANGNLHIEIPINSAPQRGSRGYTAKLVYDSRIWKTIYSGGNVWSPTNVSSNRTGWRFVTTGTERVGWDQITYSCQYQCGPPGNMCTGYWDKYQNFFFVDDNGTKRTFPIYFETGCPCHTPDQSLVTPSGPAIDGSGYWMTGGVGAVSSVKAPDGTEVYTNSSSYSLKDANGNFFSKDGNGNVVDTLGRTPAIYEAGGTGNCTGTGVSYCYKVSNSQNSDTRVKVKTAKYDVWTNFGQSGVTEYRSQGDVNKKVDVITEIILPDNTSYTFGYEYGDVQGKFGLLTSMTVPSGGQITFSHTTFPDAQGNRQRWVSGRTQQITGGGTWAYAPATCGTNCNKVTVTRPSGDETEYTFTISNGAWNTQTRMFTGSVASGTLQEKFNHDYDTSLSDPVNGGSGFIRRIRTTTTMPGPGGDLLKKAEYDYDTFAYTHKGTNYTGSRGNVTQRREYAYGSGAVGALVRKNVLTYLNDCPSGAYCSRNIVNRVTNAQVQDSGGVKKSETIYTYDSTSLTSATGIAHHDDTNFGTGFSTRGNPTVVQQWVSGTTYLSTTNTYDMTGQVRQVSNPLSNVTTYSYADNFFADSIPPTDPPPTYSPPAPTNAYLTQITLPVSGSRSFGYYWGTGKPVYQQDQNGKRTYEHFTDSLDRLNHGRVPQSGTTKRALQKVYTSATQYNMYLAAGSVEAYDTCTNCRKERLALDGLGRTAKRSVLNDPQGQVDTDTSYDTSGRVLSVSYPYRGTSQGGDTFAYDGLNRIKTVTHADSQVARTFYGAEMGSNGGRTTQLCSTAGFPTLYVDEASKKRQVWTDSLGRTVEVDEPDSSGSLTLGTCYTYNLLDNLTQVGQGSETRTYVFDGLSRRTSETTPEAGTTNYYFTTSGGALCAGTPDPVCRRTDARSITTTYTYDALSRMTGKTYSNGDPAVSYFYDQTSYNGLTITNGAGQRTGMSDASGQTAWSYDEQGHAVTEKRTIGSVTKTTSYSFNIDGSLASVTYPSGRTITYVYNAVAQPVSAVDSANGINYALSATYAPQGALGGDLRGQSASFGGITETLTYDNRLRLGRATASSTNGTAQDLIFTYLANSNLSNVNNTRRQLSNPTYTYDELNRISTASSAANSGADCWGQSHGYDRYGNLLSTTVTKCTAPALSVSVNTQNRITNSGFTYDNAGNLTSDGVASYSWSAENRLISAGGVTYTYDGDGRRVKKSNEKLVWYEVNGEELFETDLSGNLSAEYIYFNDRMIARRDAAGAVYYFFADNLGSVRVITNASGQIQRDVDFYPYGGDRVVTGTVYDWHRFAGMEFDGESSLYHTLYRQYSPTLGRWLSVDPIGGTPTDPQSLNLFAYVLDNPTNGIDPRGDCGCFPWFWCFSGTITIHFRCPDNKGCCCPYYDRLRNDPRVNSLEIYYLRLAKFVCSDLTGVSCYQNCVRYCLVAYSKSNCDRLAVPSSRIYCREIQSHAVCFAACSPWLAMPGYSSGDPHISFPVPWPVNINIYATVSFSCGECK